MKRLLIAFIFIFTAFIASAEYQVFTYTANLKTVTPTTQGGGVVSAIKLTGYLVSVACYPCGASFGKGYPSWLFVTDSAKKTIWKIPCVVTGGQFGNTCNPGNFTSMAWVDPTEADKALAKKGNQFYCTFTAISKTSTISTMKAASVELLHSGFGEGSTKLNNKTDDPSAKFNPYMKSCSGNVIGKIDLLKYIIWDPVNKYEVELAPVIGDFKLTFSATMTDKIRGTADWDKISGIIVKQMGNLKVVEQEHQEEMKWAHPSFEF